MVVNTIDGVELGEHLVRGFEEFSQIEASILFAEQSTREAVANLGQEIDIASNQSDHIGYEPIHLISVGRSAINAQLIQRQLENLRSQRQTEIGEREDKFMGLFFGKTVRIEALQEGSTPITGDGIDMRSTDRARVAKKHLDEVTAIINHQDLSHGFLHLVPKQPRFVRVSDITGYTVRVLDDNSRPLVRATILG